MAITNRERLGKALELLRAGLGSFGERELRSASGERAHQYHGLALGEDQLLTAVSAAQTDRAASRA